MEDKNTNINKVPCFQCVVRNLPGGKMKGLCSFCNDCEARHKREQKQERERILAKIKEK